MLLVFGSINLDIAMRTERLPAPGETVLGSACLVSPGGKGANQAHAARRYGMATMMVGAVGDDVFAAPALAQLVAAGVDVSRVQRVAGPTGCATVVVDTRGENQIVVVPAANLALLHTQVPDTLLAQAAAVLLQMETDAVQNERLLQRATAMGCLTVLNNAPAQALSNAVLESLDVLIVNEGELAFTVAGAGMVAGDAAATLQALAVRHRLTAVLTLGSAGVLACTPDGAAIRLPALPVQVLDTTGAGDTFAGVLTAALIAALPARGETALRQALVQASVAAGLACTRLGAQVAQPDRAEIDAALPRYAARAAA